MLYMKFQRPAIKHAVIDDRACINILAMLPYKEWSALGMYDALKYLNIFMRR